MAKIRKQLAYLFSRIAVFLCPEVEDLRYLYKLEKRIHNQRVALRENWMITEMRMSERAPPHYTLLRREYWNLVKKQSMAITDLKQKLKDNE